MTLIVPNNRLAAYEAAFASNMQALNLKPQTRFMTALSGGPDSTALACLANRYARSHGKDHQAVIVNHNIRPDATNEALRVNQRMKDRGIASRILTIDNKSPATGLQEWARNQRFAALTKLARQQGAVLLVAHHHADQVETVLMRLAHGSGVVGLAGMRSVTMRDGVLVARPLLNWHAKSLVDVLGLFGCDYEEDPSNQNSQFERVKMRNFLRDAATSGAFRADDGFRLGRVMQSLSDYLGMTSAKLWQAATCMFPTGHAVIDIEKLSYLPQPAWNYRVRQLIRQIGGRPYGVKDVSVTRLQERLLAGQNSTLGGCQFVKSLRRNESASCYVVNELGRAPEVMDVAANDDVIFAGCWRVLTKRAGRLMHAEVLAKSDQPAASKAWPADIVALPYVVRRAIPVFITLDGEVFHPQLIGMNTEVASIETALSAEFLGRSFVVMTKEINC